MCTSASASQGVREMKTYGRKMLQSVPKKKGQKKKTRKAMVETDYHFGDMRQRIIKK